ncbi:8594_t:CDS:2 [Dentiscutata erythropus]|uniref:8594_t:CDS:1 n=1 Tax=Dentiscutata erythropus TaxID=1348616 RepID=A0A9N9NPB5_9GLOM|nr:8594_t:CDS:2 [Dentiscutata erythropus]
MSNKIGSILSSYRRNGPNCQNEDKFIIRKTDYVHMACDTSRKKPGPKRKLHLQRNLITTETLIQTFADDTKKDLIKELAYLFNIMVESPTSIQSEEGAASPKYVYNTFYNMPTGNFEIDSLGSRNIHSSIKEVVDNVINKNITKIPAA